MTLPYKILAALGLLGGAFAAGWFARPPKVETKTEVITKVETVEVEKEVVKVVKVIESKPDGTTTTTETTESTKDTTTKTDSKDTAKEKATKPAVVVASYQPQYSLGVQWRPDWRDPTWTPAQATLGYRVLGNAWAEAGWDMTDRAMVFGVRVEF